MEERTVRITLRRHETTGQIAATSEDLRGLVIFGETVAEIADKLPTVVRELLESNGLVVRSVTAVLAGDDEAGLVRVRSINADPIVLSEEMIRAGADLLCDFYEADSMMARSVAETVFRAMIAKRFFKHGS